MCMLIFVCEKKKCGVSDFEGVGAGERECVCVCVCERESVEGDTAALVKGASFLSVYLVC